MERLLSARGSRARVLAIAAAMFAAIFAARLVDGDATSGITFLYVVPVVYVAIELGGLAGMGAGLLALALFAAWTALEETGVQALAYVSRGVGFVLVGAVTGRMAERLRVAVRASETAARHFEVARDLLCTIGFDGRWQSVNDSWTQVLGWTREDLLGREVLELVHPDDRAATEEAAANATGDEPSATFTNRFRTKAGEWRSLEWTALTDTATRVIYAAVRDVTERIEAEQAQKEAEEQLRYLADHDPLSGLYNRRRFEQELQRELGYAEMKGARGAVLLLDVDRFKEINDTVGHAAGDRVIASIGATLIDRLRSVDVIGRLGGDEFAVLLRRVDREEAEDVARSVRGLAIEQLPDLSVTLSVGVAVFGDGHVPTLDQLLSTADAAMYEAKRAGGNQVAVA